MNASNDLTCKEFVEIVTEYLEGTMPPEERARFEAHVAVCSGCRTYLEQIHQTIRTLGRLKENDIVPEAQDVLLKAFRDWMKKS